MKFEVLKRLRFAGTIRSPGDIVEVDGEPAGTLQSMGLIAPVTMPAAPKPRTRKKKVEDEAPTSSAASD